VKEPVLGMDAHYSTVGKWHLFISHLVTQVDSRPATRDRYRKLDLWGTDEKYPPGRRVAIFDGKDKGTGYIVPGLSRVIPRAKDLHLSDPARKPNSTTLNLSSNSQ
jgi:hypothetical protein